VTEDIRSSSVERAVARYGADPHYLLQILREVQEENDWVSPDDVDLLQRLLGVPRTKIEGVAGFYAFIATRPQGRYRVRFSDNVTDRMQGSEALLEQMCRDLWVERGKVSEDGLVSVDTTSCTGMCDQGPAMLVNERAIPRLTPARIAQVCELVRERVPLAAWPDELFRVDDNVRRRDALLSLPAQKGESLAAAIARGPEALLDEVERSGLRGRGGAGFAAAAKWRACRAADGVPRYVVCNADEGEPGTFKDRVLLASQADTVFEGMTIAAFAIGATRGMLYLRGEYRHLLDHLRAVLARRRSEGLLGAGILGRTGFDFDVEVHLGAGAYVCGEESALIESLEGKRGTPRNRPPFPVTHGYRGLPTVVNNVETLAGACLVALRGADWYTSIGTERSSGTKVLSVAGDCERPGVYEYPFGTTLRTVLDDCGARDVQAVQVGGPSGTCVSAAEADRRLAFEDLATAGAITIFDHRRDMFEVARNYVQFFAHESCGFCTPCRVGTSLLRNLMDKLGNGNGSHYDLAEIEKLNRLLQSMSHCGLGHTACNPVLDTISRFRPAYERRMAHDQFRPAFDLDRALAAARQLTGRDDAAAHLHNGGEGRA
jgi:[NiFe] hydrogenase diaphorase moiety large subunit